jgi:hypothetical protein
LLWKLGGPYIKIKEERGGEWPSTPN